MDFNLNKTINELVTNSDFLSSTIGDRSSYETMLLILDKLGWRPVSLIGKDHSYIYDHVRRNAQYVQVNDVGEFGNIYTVGTLRNNFTFYFDKLQPSVFFADPYNDSYTLEKRIEIDAIPNYTKSSNAMIHYAESFVDDVQMGDNDGYGGNEINMSDANAGTVNDSSVQSFSYGHLNGLNDLIHKTNRDFNNGSYRTLIARFHTGNDDATRTDNSTKTAISKQYGMSHGRNLLKLYPDSPNGYDNPYCRVWTYHHQYHTLVDAIRPFVDDGDKDDVSKVTQKTLDKAHNWAAFRSPQTGDGKAFQGGGERMDRYGVLNRENGMPNIAPFLKAKHSEFQDGNGNVVADNRWDEVPIKKCMFSIENLAWKGMFSMSDRDSFEELGLSPEQKGPLGGRIMWFPPYDIKFNESVNVNWNSTSFIGRGEDIYTYSNTSRDGSLSFKMLIDHPAILDFWDHKSNGVDVEGTYNTGGVDNKYNEENALLRFFAGCEILNARNQEIQVPNETPPPAPEPDPKPAPEPKTLKMYCLVYYPNNYSGSRDSATGIVKPIEYLLNGVGTQKAVVKNSISGEYELRDIPTSLDEWSDENGKRIGGYETRVNSPVSIVGEECENPNKSMAIIATNKGVMDSIISGKSYQGKIEYITNADNKKVKVYRNRTKIGNGSEEFYLGKMIGKEAIKITKENVKASRISAWNKKRWYYRVDEINSGSHTTTDVMNQVLPQKGSYMDTCSFQLNGNGYADVTQIKEFNITQDDILEGKVIALTDLFVALNGEKAATLLKDCYDQGRMEKARSVMNEENGIKITKIEFKGHASSHDINSKKFNKRNTRLAKQRAETARFWLKNNPIASKFSDRMEVIEPSISIQNSMTPTQGSVDNKIKKMWRSASIIISYTQSSSETAQEQFKNKVDEHNNPTTILTPPNGTSLSNAVGKNDNSSFNFDKAKELRFSTATINQKAKSNSPTAEKKAEEIQKEIKNDKHKTTINKYRYDNEGLFFQKLALNEPFLRNEISKKIKYFDPAYHSISPEGFNARLTFLHQCTRQGPTIGGTDPRNGNTANNLAFGRPPVCILRIGDFYYTKVIITSMNIDYDPMVWDLNQEGIGVMPMMANINLQFHFIGGSDLAGPISRLQNAISFNYYANTGVYDNRSEEIYYDDSGKPIAFKPFEGKNYYPPTNLSTNEKDNPKTMDTKEETKKDMIDNTDVNPDWQINSIDEISVIGKK